MESDNRDDSKTQILRRFLRALIDPGRIVYPRSPGKT